MPVTCYVAFWKLCNFLICFSESAIIFCLKYQTKHFNVSLVIKDCVLLYLNILRNTSCESVKFSKNLVINQTTVMRSQFKENKSVE